MNDLYHNAAVQLDTILNKNVGKSIWEIAGEAADVMIKKPMKKSGDSYEVYKQPCKKGNVSYIIKDKTNNAYISLNEEEFFVWELLDGKSTLMDICHLYFLKYNKISRMPVKLIDHLEMKDMLIDMRWNIYNEVKNAQIKSWKFILGKMTSFFLSSKLSLKHFDKFVSFTYNKVAWIFFRREALVFFILLIAAGLAIFFNMGYYGQKFAVKNYITQKISLGVLIICSLLPVILHELAHAFACKKYGRQVNKAGIMLYFGMPVLFVETTDIWMRPRIERIVVSLAGPFTDLLVGSFCFLCHSIFGNVYVLQLFPLIGLIAYIRCLYNFNPLLEFDGYYILMDLLDIPELRKRSLSFISKGGIKRLIKLKKFKKEEYIFLLYGIFSTLYTYWMIFFMLYLWQNQIRAFLIVIWNNRNTSFFSQIIITVSLVFILIRLGFLGKILYRKLGALLKRFHLNLSQKKQKFLQKPEVENEKNDGPGFKKP